jgi:hypothetical protein
LRDGERALDHMTLPFRGLSSAIWNYHESREGRLGESNANGKNGEDRGWIGSDFGGPRNHRKLEGYKALLAHLHHVSDACQPAWSVGFRAYSTR